MKVYQIEASNSTLNKVSVFMDYYAKQYGLIGKELRLPSSKLNGGIIHARND